MADHIEQDLGQKTDKQRLADLEQRLSIFSLTTFVAGVSLAVYGAATYSNEVAGFGVGLAFGAGGAATVRYDKEITSTIHRYISMLRGSTDH